MRKRKKHKGPRNRDTLRTDRILARKEKRRALHQYYIDRKKNRATEERTE